MTPRAAPVIYVVDDDDAVRDAIAAVLETAGYAVATFGSARQFLAAYAPAPDACLIVDLDLPEMDGSALVGTLVAGQIELPAVLMSGRLSDPGHTLPRGVVGILRKPFGQTELLDRVRFALGHAAPARRGPTTGHP